MTRRNVSLHTGGMDNDEGQGGGLDGQGAEVVLLGEAAKRHPAGGRRFTAENAREMARRSAESRARNRAAGRATPEEVARNLRALTGRYQRDQLGPTAFAAAVELVGRVATGEVPVRNAGEAAELLRALVDIGRMEGGEATSHALVGHVSVAELAERLRRHQAGRAPSSAAVVVDDEAPPG